MEGTLRRGHGRWVLRFERVLPHRPDKVWRALTESSELAHWFPSDIQERFVLRNGEAPVTHGEVIELRLLEVLEYSWGDALLRWELHAEGDGCRMVFTHTFDDAATAARDAAGWESCLERLGSLLVGVPRGFDMHRWQVAFERYVNALTLMAGPQRGPPEGARSPA